MCHWCDCNIAVIKYAICLQNKMQHAYYSVIQYENWCSVPCTLTQYVATWYHLLTRLQLCYDSNKGNMVWKYVVMTLHTT